MFAVPFSFVYFQVFLHALRPQKKRFQSVLSVINLKMFVTVAVKPMHSFAARDRPREF